MEIQGIQGPLSKWTNVVKGWQYRWFVLDKINGCLSYYISREQMIKETKRGCVKLKSAVLEIDDSDETAFAIISDNKQFHLQAQGAEDRDRWIDALQECIHFHSAPPILRKLSENSNRVSATSSDIQVCVAEAEGYYSLLSDQIKSFNTKLSLSSDLQSEYSQQVKDLTKEYSVAFRDSLDQMHPMISLPDPHLPTDRRNSRTATELTNKEETNVKDILARGSNGVMFVPVTAENESAVPAMDCNSDSDTDYFYDVETFSTEGENTPGHKSDDDTETNKSGCLDPDDVIVDAELEELDNVFEGVSQHKGVLMHMASQVKVGMDLTRITLPTFILEKRSLLEMYAEFLSYPHLFTSIPEGDTEEKRFIKCVQYFLSTFSAARKGTIAKKPYNPVIGEVFKCYWDMSQRRPMTEEESQLVRSGPVAWAGHDSLTFIAEQVSHHPPISGFYAEYPNKRISVSGHNWTQSKYFGLSIGVHNVGIIRLNLHEFDEEYTCTLPKAYGRSILTVPWIEIGGKCYMECNKTGYLANIEFHCKPFYGGKKHRVTADITHKPTGKLIMKIDGEWNGVIFADYPGGIREVFLDTHNLQTVMKKIQKLDAMDKHESRYVWRDLTSALKAEDLERATDAKHAVEEEQRAGVRERNESGEVFRTQHFDLIGEEWKYKHPLMSRIPSNTSKYLECQ